MEPELTGRIVVPGDPQYDAARQEFNNFFNRFPLVIVFAQQTQDVVNAVRWARDRDVPIRMRSGRHNYEGLSVVDAGIVIDVSEMKQVEVDHKRGTATVQTGLRDFALYETLGAEGLVVPGGLCPTTGVAGLTLGGGASALARPWGLTIDHLLELEMVDADGRVLHASADHNADLFWASRGGGGGNFGICTSFRFRTHPIDTVAYANIGWDLRDLEPVLRAWQEYTVPGADERFTPLLSIINGSQPLQSLFPGMQTLQAQLQSKVPNQPSQEVFPLFMQGVFLGSAAQLHHLLEPLLRAGSPRQVIIAEIPWLEAVVRIAATQPGSPEPFKSTGPFIHHRLPDIAVATIRRFIDEPPTANVVSVFFHGLGGAVARVPSRATAYYYRRALSNINPWTTWSSPDGAAPGIRWVEDLARAMRPFTRGVYVNTPDLSIKNWPKAYYGNNFDRLTRVKRRYDPENVFHFPQSIPPARNHTDR
jgi:FAD/FMN-containing dehydrogenase